MAISASYFRKIQDLDPALRDALLGLAEEVERSREQSVNRDEFLGLREIVKELAEAQKRTETRLEELQSVVRELAEAQKRTEMELTGLVIEHKKTREQLGGLSATVGYRLEDEAFKALPALLKKDFGLELQSALKRGFVADREGKLLEVNIIGEGTREGRRVTVFGEAKSQLSKRLVREFLNKKLQRFSGVFQEILPVLLTYMISEPDAEEYAKAKGITLYYSYQF